MGVRVWSSCDGDCMAQMDPAATKTAYPMTDYSDYGVSPGPTKSAASRAPVNPEPMSSGTVRTSSADRLIDALKVAADKTATSIAHGTKQTRLEVRERLNEVIGWLVAMLRTGADDSVNVPPVIAREYVASLKSNFLTE